MPLIGAYQAANALVAAGLVIATGGEIDLTLANLQRVAPVRGRLERAAITRTGAPVYVDYAHTPDGLEAAISALRPHAENRLITVFGAGGDRDTGKRPLMGEVATRLSDSAIVTDDNPRSEDPALIRRDVMAGAPGATEIGGRREAIAAAIAQAQAGDIVLIAGKGHEQGQIVGDRVLPLRRRHRRAGVRGMSGAFTLPSLRRTPGAATGFRGGHPYGGPGLRRGDAIGRRSMTAPLWSAFDIAAAVDGEVHGCFKATGVAFDSREIGPGDLFIALKGESTDGHRFLDQVFARGAAGAITSEACEGAHVRVADTTVALNALGAAGRARMQGKVIGVTGSVGKTGTKEALFACLDRALPGQVHRSVKSYNNHTGVPLSLARMPADTKIGVFEMGMNHEGELAELTRLVRPHVAIVTAIAPAHSAYFTGEEAIADAKGEIFQGLEPGGIAIIPYDSPHRERLAAAARPHAAKIITFGLDRNADVRVQDIVPMANGTLVSLILPDAELTFTIAPPGDHWVSNAMAVIAAVWAVGGDLAAAGVAFAEMPGLPGRGQRSTVAVGDGKALVIDESYNANPASMAATIKVLGEEKAERRIAILGEMRELGAASAVYHADLAGPLRDAKVDFALLVGSEMTALANALEGRIDFAHVPDAGAALDSIGALLAPGDAILIKGSNAIGLSRLVEHLRSGAGAGGRTTCST